MTLTAEDAHRRDVSPLPFRNAEWVAVQSPEGRAVFATIQARVKKLAETRLLSAK